MSIKENKSNYLLRTKLVTRGYSWPVPSWPHSFYCKVHSSKSLMGIWATNLLHRFSDAMQLCCALEFGTFFLKILLRIAIMAILSSIPPLSNSQISNKHFKLTRDIFRYNIWPAIDSYRSHTRGKSIIPYVGMLRNYLKTLPSTKIVKTNFPSRNTGKGLYGYLIYLLKNDPVYIVISTSYRLLTGANKTTARRFRFRQSATKWVETLRPKLGFFTFY